LAGDAARARTYQQKLARGEIAPAFSRLRAGFFG
jgi:hypothetical protein